MSSLPKFSEDATIERLRRDALGSEFHSTIQIIRASTARSVEIARLPAPELAASLREVLLPTLPPYSKERDLLDEALHRLSPSAVCGLQSAVPRSHGPTVLPQEAAA